jgi:histidyl-tRNA synthetase
MSRIAFAADRKLSLEPFTEYSAKIVLDKALAGALNSRKPNKNAPVLQYDAINSKVPGYPEHVVRAILMMLLKWVIDGTQLHVRVRLVEFIAEVMNAGVHLYVPQSEEAELALKSAMNGLGFVVGKDGKLNSLKEVLDERKIAIVEDGLSASEAMAVDTSGAVRKGVLANIASCAEHLADVSDVLVALGFECSQSNPEVLEDVEKRPHRGALVSFENVVLLLKNSKNVGKAQRKETGDPKGLIYAPYLIGAAREVVQDAVKSTLLELNAREHYAPPYNTKHLGSYHHQPVLTALLNVSSALVLLANASAQRLKDIVEVSSALFTETNFVESARKVADQSSSLNAQVSKELLDLHQQSAASWTQTVEAKVLELAVFISTNALAILNFENEMFSKVIIAKEDSVAAFASEVEDAAEGKDDDKKKKKSKHPKFVIGGGVSDYIKYVRSVNPKDCSIDPSLSREIIRIVLTPSNENRKPKIAKGTRDFGSEQMAVREKVFELITKIFKRHGAVGLDTPVFELRETLVGKYGEESKLIYDLADQGGELLSLRYDLTVPFARYLAMNNVGNIKRFHIAKVYRRDNIAVEKGRFREFYQCDFDIAGKYDTMIPDAEVLKVLGEILGELELPFEVKLNHRSLLDACMEISGVPAHKFRTIGSAIDKLDKAPWSEVREEMLEKGLPQGVADKIGEFVVLKGSPLEMLAKLRSMPDIQSHKGASDTLNEMAILFEYLGAMNMLDKISFDLSLARGLNYYTGVIYEAVLTIESKVGSIAAGGRYDNLVGSYCSKQIPCVGVSIGIERIFAIMMERAQKEKNVRSIETQVLVASVGPNLTKERFSICSTLWKAGIPTEMLYVEKPNLKKQLTHALELAIPLIVFIGEEELKNEQVKLKNTFTKTETSVTLSDLVSSIRKELENLPASPLPLILHK